MVRYGYERGFSGMIGSEMAGGDRRITRLPYLASNSRPDADKILIQVICRCAGHSTRPPPTAHVRSNNVPHAPAPAVPMRRSTSSRLSRRIAPRTALFALRYSLPVLRQRPPTAAHQILNGVGHKRGARVPNLNGSDGSVSVQNG